MRLGVTCSSSCGFIAQLVRGLQWNHIDHSFDFYGIFMDPLKMTCFQQLWFQSPFSKSTEPVSKRLQVQILRPKNSFLVSLNC